MALLQPNYWMNWIGANGFVLWVTMCRVEKGSEKCECRKQVHWDIMGLKFLGESNKAEKLKSSGPVSRSRIKLWMIRAITTILLWTCVVQLMALGEMWGPRLLKGWPSCFSHSDLFLSAELSSVPAKVLLPPKSKFTVVNSILLFLPLFSVYCWTKFAVSVIWYASDFLVFPLIYAPFMHKISPFYGESNYVKRKKNALLNLVLFISFDDFLCLFFLVYGPSKLYLSLDEKLGILNQSAYSKPVNCCCCTGVYKNNGYLMVSCNGGLNQMRAAVSWYLTLSESENIEIASLCTLV